MDQKPRNPKESLFANHMGTYAIINGIIIGVLTLIAFNLGEHLYSNSLMHAQTLSFVVLSFSQLFFSLSMRNKEKSLFKVGIFTNKYLLYSILLGILIQLLIITIPFLSSVFSAYTLTLRDWALCIGISLIPFVLNELFKVFKYSNK